MIIILLIIGIVTFIGIKKFLYTGVNKSNNVQSSPASPVAQNVSRAVTPDWIQTYGKLVGFFLLIPLLFWLAFPQFTKILWINYSWKSILVYLLFGAGSFFLSTREFWEDDWGRRIIYFFCLVLVLVFFVKTIIGYQDNKLAVANTSKQKTVASNPTVNQASSETVHQVQIIFNEKWITVTYADNKRYLQTVTTGQLIHILNEGGIQYTTVIDKQGQAAFSDKLVRIRVEKDGRLRFKLPVDSSIKYYIDSV